MSEREITPGKIAFIGSGETTPVGGLIFEKLAANLPQPLDISVLETPAGFELNSPQVAGRVADYMAKRLQNYAPAVHVVAARKRHTPFSPDDDETIQDVWKSGLIFMGPGSPTYAVRQLTGSKLWHILQARHRFGASLAFASAATIALGRYCLPVYEIYKAGEDIHWRAGLDLFSSWNLSLIFIPHWNNTDGGKELDTSRCFMGVDRFEALVALLPEPCTILGVDEHTAAVFDFNRECIAVLGKGSVHIQYMSERHSYPKGSHIPFSQLGQYRRLAELNAGSEIPPELWQKALSTLEHTTEDDIKLQVPQQILDIVNEREQARREKDWQRSDALRDRIATHGWQIKDTPSGPLVERTEE
ncbi:MAG: cysteinyl-tRNA synthetase [Anaerolineae bacterium]|nr:cysteinyl-tRNA synthetase [Anaerolineae bacterium]